ncbi:MAG: hypothetical protein LBB94_11210 [Clostridiales bacterium]|nr:hypothetical protein [Clostridiales bacterium]
MDKISFSKINLAVIESERVFDRVLEVNGYAGKEKRDRAEADIEDSIITEYDNALADSGMSLEQFSAVYTTGDWYDGEFNVYLSLKKKVFYWLESAVDFAFTHCTSGFPFQNFKQVSNTYAEVMRKHCAVSPDGKYATPVLLESSTKSIDYYNYKVYSLWDPDDLLRRMDAKHSVSVINAYSVPSEINGGSVLLLRMNDAWPTTNTPVEERGNVEYGLYIDLREPMLKNIYTDLIALDWYAPIVNKVYIKPHPQRSLSEGILNKYWGDNAVNLGDCPFQLIAKYLEFREISFQTVIGYGSTSNSAAEQIAAEKIFLSQNYWNSYFQYNRLFAALYICKLLGSRIKSIKVSETVFEQAQYLNKWVVHTEQKCVSFKFSAEFAANELIIVDNISPENRDGWRRIFHNLPPTSIVAIFNANGDGSFYAKEFREYLIPICIEKIKQREITLDPCVTETLWIFSKDTSTRSTIFEMAIERELPRLGIKIVIKKQDVSWYIQEYIKLEQNALYERVESLSHRYDNLYNACLQTNGDVIYRVLLRMEDNLHKYLELLKVVSKNYIVIVAVRDTTGNNVGAENIALMREMGFTGITAELWRSYIGVIAAGEVVCDWVGAVDECLAISDDVSIKWKKTVFHVYSKPYKSGNEASICVNGTEYAANKRGLNFVIFDSQKNELIDSVAFDAHEAKCVCYR